MDSFDRLLHPDPFFLVITEFRHAVVSKVQPEIHSLISDPTAPIHPSTRPSSPELNEIAVVAVLPRRLVRERNS